MSQQIINVGVTSNDGTGDTLRVSQQKANSNFDELYARPDFTDAPSDSNIYGRKDGDWELITGGGSTPNLQAVTDVGNVTTNEIKAKWFEFYDAANDAYAKVEVSSGGINFYDFEGFLFKTITSDGSETIANKDNEFILQTILENGLTADRNRQEPDKDGMYAMLDDIPTINTIDGVSVDYSAPLNPIISLGDITPDKVASCTSVGIYADGGDSNNVAKILGSNITEVRVQELQDKNGTFAYMDDIPSISGLVPNTRTVNSKALSSNVTLNTDDIAESGTPTNKWFTNARAIASTLTSFVSGAGTVSATDTILQSIQKIVGNIALKADLASPTFTGSPTAPTQTASDNSTKLATTAYVDTGLGLKADKSLGAYKMRANNTNATANGTEQVFKAIDQQSYGGTITFTAGTAPSGALSSAYSWMQMGNMVTLTLSATYANAGATVTQCVIPLPTDMPNPIKPTGRTAASEKLYTANGQMMATTTGTTAAAFSSYLRANSANTGFEFVITMSSGAYKAIDLTCTYPVS